MKKIIYSSLVVMISLVLLSNTNKTKAVDEDIIALEMNPADLVFDSNGSLVDGVTYFAKPIYKDGTSGKAALPGWEICPGNGVDCDFSLTYNGTTVTFHFYKGKGRKNFEYHWW
jgi:hypothetical protein